MLELDAAAKLITKEEYYAYGGTAVWAARSAQEASNKVIRYSGKERDATGLYYYGARYYMPWLARWISTDPLGDVDSLNRYAFVHQNPMTFIDADGRIVTLPERAEHSEAIVGAIGKLVGNQVILNVSDDNELGFSETSNYHLYPIGVTLLERLVKTEQNIEIKYMTPEDPVLSWYSTRMIIPPGFRSPGNMYNIPLDSTINFKPYDQYVEEAGLLNNIPTLDPETGNAYPGKTDDYMALGHEMIHADRAARGRVFKNGVMGDHFYQVSRIRVPNYRGFLRWQRIFVRERAHADELATVGIRGFYDPSVDIVENGMRREQHMNRRVGYFRMMMPE
jgi:RHS repeat-associated protein